MQQMHIYHLSFFLLGISLGLSKFVVRWFFICLCEVCFFTVCNVSSSSGVSQNRSCLREACRPSPCFGQVVLKLFGKSSVPRGLLQAACRQGAQSWFGEGQVKKIINNFLGESFEGKPYLKKAAFLFDPVLFPSLSRPWILLLSYVI